MATGLPVAFVTYMEHILKKYSRRKIFLVAGFLTIVLLIFFCAILVSSNLSRINDQLDVITLSAENSSPSVSDTTIEDFRIEVTSHISTMRNILFLSFGVLIIFSGVIIYEAYISNRFKEELVDQKDYAEFLAGAKRDFIANMSHEMKTPLHAIFGVTQELYKDKNLVENYGSLLTKLVSASKHLLNMVEDLLMVSNDGEIVTSFQNTTINLTDSIVEITEEYKRKAKLKGLEFNLKSHVAANIILKGDGRRLQHIIAHILDNSLKFTHQGKIEISYWLKEKNYQESSVYLQISDTGIGISEEKLKSIFSELEQGDNTATKQYPGIGVGLAITRKLVTWQGGSISVSSQEGVFTKFTISLPYKLDVQTSITPKPINTEISQPKILVVDDDEFNLLLASGMLKKKNCLVETATEGSEACELLNIKEYDVILLDIHLPRISGVGVAEALRSSHGKNSHTPILAVTATLLNDGVLEKFKTAGINDWLPKPYNEEQLWEKINQLMEAEKYHVS